MKYLTPAIPALICFGPLTMVMGLRADALVMPYLGALMTSFGLVAMFMVQQHHLRGHEGTDGGQAAARKATGADHPSGDPGAANH